MAIPIHPTNPRNRDQHVRPAVAADADKSTNFVSEDDVELLNSMKSRAHIDSCISAIALILLLPILFVIAALIFFETGLPILFSQSRVGRNGQLFRVLKFRTMRKNSTGPHLTVGGDSRVTHVGFFLRKFKLDELPQLWNILRAEMAVVGPRPEVPEFVDVGKPEWRYVLRVRPGITDPASIVFHQEEKLLAKCSDPIRYYRESLLPAKLAMNIAYMKERSIWLDFQVVLKSVLCAVFPGKLKSNQAECLVPDDPK